MCQTCVTAFDTAATNGVILAAFAVNLLNRIRGRFSHQSRLEREMAVWEANADFVESLGHDPLSILGVPPAIPTIPSPAHSEIETSRCNRNRLTTGISPEEVR